MTSSSANPDAKYLLSTANGIVYGNDLDTLTIHK